MNSGGKPSRTIRWDDPAYSTKSSDDSSSLNNNSVTSMSNSSVAALPVGNSIVKSVPVAVSAVTSTSWRELKTRDGRPYYYNSVTQKTVWEMPKEFSDYLDFMQRGGPKGRNTPSSESDVIFWEILRERRITSKWTWEEALRAIITHQNYKCIPTLQERKASFQRYCEAMRSVEEEEARFQTLSRKESFKSMLASDPQITSDTKWSDVVDKFGKTEAFTAISSSKERVQLFEEYQSELRRTELESVWERRKENSRQIASLLKSLNVSIDLKRGKMPEWSSLKDKLIGSIPGADAMEYLLAFEEHVQELIKEFQASRRAERQAELLKEVEYREAFKKLLDVLKEHEILTPFSTWSSILPHIQETSEYKNLLGIYLYGSCPIDLFYDALDRCRQAYLMERSRIADFFMMSEFKSCEADSLPPKFRSFTQFKEALSQSLGLEGLLVKYSFMELYGPESIDSDRNTINAYKHLLKHHDPPIKLHESWTLVRERLKDTEEFKAVACEEDLELYFLKFKKWLSKHSLEQHEEVAEEQLKSTSTKPSRWDKRGRDHYGDDTEKTKSNIRNRRDRY